MNLPTYDIHVPVPVDVDTASADAEFDPCLRGVDIFEAGDLDFTGINGVRQVRTFPAVADGGAYPYRYVMQIKTIHQTTTTIPDDSLTGLR